MSAGAMGKLTMARQAGLVVQAGRADSPVAKVGLGPLPLPLQQTAADLEGELPEPLEVASAGRAAKPLQGSPVEIPMVI